MTTTNSLIRLQISGFKGLLAFEAAPNGKSLTVRGKNGAGKSSVIDALFWALGGSLDGEVINNASDVARVEVVFGDYLIARRQARGKKPTLEVKSADGKAKFASPTALLAGFVGAVERRTFSAKSAKDRAEVLRRLAPGLDCGDLDGERARLYEERTGVNRDGKMLRAQAEDVVVPTAPAEVGEERAIVDVVDVAAIAAKKGDVERERTANEDIRRLARGAREQAEKVTLEVQAAADRVERARAALTEAEKAHAKAQLDEVHFHQHAAEQEKRAAALVDPDTTAIDDEIREARQMNADARRLTEDHNRKVRAAAQQAAEVKRAAAERTRIEKQAAEREAAAAHLTSRIEQIDKEKAERLAAATLPIPGIALAGDVVTFDDGAAGPVDLDALNTATRIRLDVAIAAALGHRVISVRDASLLDVEQRAAIERFAAERGVQLLAEVVASGEPLTAVIEEADPAVLEAVVSQSEFQL